VNRISNFVTFPPRLLGAAGSCPQITRKYQSGHHAGDAAIFQFSFGKGFLRWDGSFFALRDQKIFHIFGTLSTLSSGSLR